MADPQILVPTSGVTLPDEDVLIFGTTDAGADFSATVTVKVYGAGHALVATLTDTRSNAGAWEVTASLPPGDYTAAAEQLNTVSGQTGTSPEVAFTVAAAVEDPDPPTRSISPARVSRELVPLRLNHIVTAPSGRRYRWAEDERNPARTPSGVRFSTTMPGGHETIDARVPRRVAEAAPDAQPLASWEVYGPGQEPAFSGRLERAPRSSGDQRLDLSLGCRGHRGVDRQQGLHLPRLCIELTEWSGPSIQRRIDIENIVGGSSSIDGSVASAPAPGDAVDVETGLPALQLFEATTPWSLSGRPVVEMFYRPGEPIGTLWFNWQKNARISASDPN